MKIGIMQPYLFPYIGYFQLINCVDKFVVHDDVQFIKGGWINRNRILMGSRDYMFTFSIKSASAYDKINQREFSNSVEGDKKKFLRNIEYAYSKAPFYKEVFEVVESSINSKIGNVSNAIIQSITYICKYLEINTEFIISSNINKDESLKGEQRVINICKKLNATQYINPIGGIELYSKEEFNKHGIVLNFLKTNKINYKQFNNKFVQNLSIIDIMMFKPKDEIKTLLEEYQLI